MDWAIKILRYICYTIDSVVYWLGSIMYRIFYLVSDAQIFDTESGMGEIVNRIYVILGVVMFFVLAYNIILLIINPDNTSDNSDKSIPKLIQNTIISILLIVLLPTIFNYMFQIQHGIIHNNVLGNIILGGRANDDNDRRTAGTKVMATVFATFYHPIVEDSDGNRETLTPQDCVLLIDDSDAPPVCDIYLSSLSAAYSDNRIGEFIQDSDLHKAVKDGEMEYIPVISTIAGGIAAYLFLSFALDVGVRAVKLGFLQIIAPIPVILRITKPHGGMFDKWFKEVKDTYLSVFLRLVVIFFAIFTINLVTTNIDLWPIEKSTTSGGTTVNENGHSHSSGKFSAPNADIEILTSSLNKEYHVQTLDDINTLSDDNSTNKVELLAVDGSAPGTESGILRMAANLIVILGMLQFAKDAPKLIESLFGTNGTLKWRIKDKLNDNEYFKRAATAVGTIGTNTFKNGVDLIAGVDPYGNKRSRWGILASQIRNMPTSTITGIASGWKRGGNVDFSKGIKQGFSSIGRESTAGMADIQTKIDQDLLKRSFGPKLQIGNHRVSIPFLTHTVGGIKQAYSDFKYQNEGIGGNNVFEKLSIRMNRKVNSTGANAMTYISNDIGEILKLADKGVEEVTRTFQAEITENGRRYAELINAVRNKKDNYMQQFYTTYGDDETVVQDKTQKYERYVEFRQQAGIDSKLEQINRLIASAKDSRQRARYIQEKRNIVNKFNASVITSGLNISKDDFEKFEGIYDKLDSDSKSMAILDSREKRLAKEKETSTSSLASQMKQKQQEKYAENLVSEEFGLMVRTHINNHMNDVTTASRTVSQETMHRLIDKHFGYIKPGLTMQEIYTMVSRNENIDAKFVNAFQNFAKALQSESRGQTPGTSFNPAGSDNGGGHK